MIKGELVEIINRGSYFPNHVEAARALKTTKWTQDVPPEIGQVGVITGIWRDRSNQTIYLVDLGKIEILIGKGGIKLKSDWDEESN